MLSKQLRVERKFERGIWLGLPSSKSVPSVSRVSAPTLEKKPPRVSSREEVPVTVAGFRRALAHAPLIWISSGFKVDSESFTFYIHHIHDPSSSCRSRPVSFNCNWRIRSLFTSKGLQFSLEPVQCLIPRYLIMTRAACRVDDPRG